MEIMLSPITLKGSATFPTACHLRRTLGVRLHTMSWHRETQELMGGAPSEQSDLQTLLGQVFERISLRHERTSTVVMTRRATTKKGIGTR
jgi:hypothetical protein